jgi:two-component system, chemotaxis family, chemotaxis protein CheY
MTAEPRTVMIVDDDVDMRDSLTFVLEAEGYRVSTAGDGLEAMDLLHRDPSPDLILLDWMMPRCDGAQFRALQLQEPALAEIPVVLLTADIHIHDKQDSLGVEGFLSKPVQLDDLLAAVESYSR